jgi:DNA-binding LacI/PurR family transcriptional regulator
MTISDVAAEAGVSVATVSRVLNDRGYPIRPETRRRVVEAIEKLDFRPNELARGLLLKRTQTIGLVIPDITNPYYPVISRGVEDVASDRGYAVIFCNTDRDAAKSEYYVNVLLQKQVDGLIIAGGGTDFTRAFERFAEHGTRVVFVGKPSLPWPSVRVPNEDGTVAAMAHLAELGHQQVGFIGGPQTLSTARDRLAGYRRAVRDHGLVASPSLERPGDFSEQSGYREAERLLRDTRRPTAILAANDRMAIGALAAAADRGLVVPDDLSVVGFDDIPLVSYVRPALTTVALPAYEMGAAAMRLLLDLLQNKDDGPTAAAPTVRLPVTLVVRDSTAPPTGTGPSTHATDHRR